MDNHAIKLATHNETSVLWDDLPETARAYLAQYGMNKSLQDAASGTEGLAIMAWLNVVDGASYKDGKGKAGQALVKKARDAYGILATNYATASAYAAAVVTAQKDERLADILSGDVSVGVTGPRLKGIDAVMRDVALEMLRGAYAKKSLKFPADAATVKDLITELLVKRGDMIRDEAQRRMDVAATTDDADDILAEIGIA